MTNQATVSLIALTAEEAEAELGIVSHDPATRFFLLTYWAEAAQYDVAGEYKTREGLKADNQGEEYRWGV